MAGDLADPGVRALAEEKRGLAGAGPADRAQRREWYHRLPSVTELLRPAVVEETDRVRAELDRCEQEFRTTYERARYGRSIDYTAPPPVALDPARLAWVTERASGGRS